MDILNRMPRKNQPIVFLDINNVLNSIGYFKSLSCANIKDRFKNEEINSKRRFIFQKAEYLCPVSTGIFVNLINEFNAAIVLINDWAKKMSVGEIAAVFKNRGFTLNEDIFLGNIDGVYGEKPQKQIMEWIRLASTQVPYVVLDSRSDSYSISNIVSPNAALGITLFEYQKAKDCLISQGAHRLKRL